MRFLKFEISNFKGIERAVLPLGPAGANIFTLIGLNESGKTTILEALSAFGFSTEDTTALYAANSAEIDPTSFVPKQHKSAFSGVVAIHAHIAFEHGEKETIVRAVEREHNCTIDMASVPDVFKLTRGYKFENSDPAGYIRSLGISLIAKNKGERKGKARGIDDKIWASFSGKITESIPQILYFPTFVFNQPARIYLNQKDEKDINRLYREIIENVANSLPKPLDIKKHIVDRVLN